jgi:hypothetical protein
MEVNGRTSGKTHTTRSIGQVTTKPVNPTSRQAIYLKAYLKSRTAKPKQKSY